MNKLRSVLVTTSLLFGLSALPAFAHTDNVSSSQYQFMRQMMGAGALSQTEDLEVDMMGEANHERMEQLMSKLIAGNLTAAEQAEFIELMQDASTQAGSQMMMNRMMTANMMGNFSGAGGYSMMSMMGGGFGAASVAFWVTVILLWILIIVMILAILSWMGRKAKS